MCGWGEERGVDRGEQVGGKRGNTRIYIYP